MRGILMVCAALLAACSGPAPDKGYRVTGRYGPLVYILLTDATPRSADAWQRVVLAACGDAAICNVKIWTDPGRVARGFPMTDREVAGIEAAYLVNRGTGVDGFICQPFGAPSQRCAK